MSKMIRPIAVLLLSGLGAQLHGQTRALEEVAETLMSAPLPSGTAPTYSVFNATSQPSPENPPAAGPGHPHEGPVFVYVVSGKMESQIEPDASEVYSSGEFFLEAPGRVHRLFRNASRTEVAKLLTFQVGYTGAGKPNVKATLKNMTGQEARLSRLSLMRGASLELRANENPETLYVLEGRVEIENADGPKEYAAGSLLSTAATGVTIRNLSEPATVLLFQVSKQSAKGQE